MNHIRKIKKLILLIAMPLVLWLFFNQAAYWHFHITGHGIIVEHAHPFKNNTQPGTPFQKHHHSDFEYSILAQLSHIASILVVLLVLGIMIKSRIIILNTFYRKDFSHSDYIFIQRLRGPPVYS
jgi:hypothetical protein